MGFKYLLNKFTQGELDPRFLAEADYDGYRKAGRKARNVICLPQGGVKRRFGTVFEQEVTDGINPITDPTVVRLIEFESTLGHFDIIINADWTGQVAFDIHFHIDVIGPQQMVHILAPANTYTDAMIRQIRWVIDYDRIILLHKDVRPYELRVNTALIWTLSPITFQFFPTFDFTPQDDPLLLPTPNTPYTAPNVTFTPNLVAATTVTANIAVYTSNHVGGLYLGNSGVFRITGINGAGTVASGYALEDFASTAAIRGDLSALYERMWNDGEAIAAVPGPGPAPAGIPRLWPSRGCFYQSRLLLGNSPSLPGIAAASVVKEYFNFDDSSATPSDGWAVESNITGIDRIMDLVPNKSLTVITDKGTSATTILLNDPTTPSNVFLQTQGTEPSRDMDATILDNQILFADRAGNTIWSMTYDVPDTGYSVYNASILSTHLIRNPQWADIYDPAEVDGRYLLLINSDGTMAMLNSILDQNIRAWTLAQTTGSFIDVSSTSNTTKVLVRRKVGTGVLIEGDIDAAYNVTGGTDVVDGDENTFLAFRNITPDVLNAEGVAQILDNPYDYLLLGGEIPWTSMRFFFDDPAQQDVDLTFEFLTDTGAWEAFTPTTDTTVGFTQDGDITWTYADVSNWKAQPLIQTDKLYGDYQNLYWIRIRRNNENDLTYITLLEVLFNTQNRIYLERLSFDVFMDCQFESSSDIDGEVFSADVLAGQNAFVFADDFPLRTYYIDSDGNFDLGDNEGERALKIGLDYTVNLTPMPVGIIMGNGWHVYEPMHNIKMFVDFYESLGITMNGQGLPQFSPGAYLSEDVPVPVTDYYEIPTFGGWDPRFEFVISQSYPAPMTLLGVSYTVEINA